MHKWVLGYPYLAKNQNVLNKFEITEEGLWCMHFIQIPLDPKWLPVRASPVHTGRLHGHNALVIRGASLQC